MELESGNDGLGWKSPFFRFFDSHKLAGCCALFRWLFGENVNFSFFLHRSLGWRFGLQSVTSVLTSLFFLGLFYRSASLYHPQRRAILHLKDMSKRKGKVHSLSVTVTSVTVNVFSTCLCAADGVDKNNNRLQNTSTFCKRLLFSSTPSTAHKHVEKTLTSIGHSICTKFCSSQP